MITNWRDRPPVALVPSETQRSHESPGAETKPCHQSHQSHPKPPVCRSITCSLQQDQSCLHPPSPGQVLSWSGILHAQCNSSTLQGCSWEYSTVQPQQQEHSPSPFLSAAGGSSSPAHGFLRCTLNKLDSRSVQDGNSILHDPLSLILTSFQPPPGFLHSSFQLFLWQAYWTHKIINSQLISCCLQCCSPDLDWFVFSLTMHPRGLPKDEGWGMEKPSSPVLFVFSFSLNGSVLEQAGHHHGESKHQHCEEEEWWDQIHWSKNRNKLRAVCLLAPHSQIICHGKGGISEWLQRNTDWLHNTSNSFEGSCVA